MERIAIAPPNEATKNNAMTFCIETLPKKL
jgi:hypothetical protein